MGLFIVIGLLLLAAAAGILGTVLEVTLVIVLSVVLTIVILVWLASWYVRRRVRGFQHDVERRFDESRKRRTAYDVTSDDPPRGALGDGS